MFYTFYSPKSNNHVLNHTDILNHETSEKCCLLF